jgi:hypothetical protein
MTLQKLPSTSDLGHLIELDLQDFQRACASIPQYRATAPELAAVVRRLASWSLEQSPLLTFVPKGQKESSTVSFSFTGNRRSLWMVYPGGTKSNPRLDFLTRATHYLPANRTLELRSELVRRGIRGSLGKENEIMSVPLSALLDRTREEATVQFFEWALQQPDLQSRPDTR